MIFHKHTSLARWVGPEQAMSAIPDGQLLVDEKGLLILEDGKDQDRTNVGPETETTITLDKLTDEQKKRFDDFMKACQQKYFETLKMIHGKVVHKLSVPRVMHGETSGSRTEGIPTRAELSNLLNESVHQAVINQYGVLTNTVQNLIRKTIDGFNFKELGSVGLVYTTSS